MVAIPLPGLGWGWGCRWKTGEMLLKDNEGEKGLERGPEGGGAHPQDKFVQLLVKRGATVVFAHVPILS